MPRRKVFRDSDDEEESVLFENNKDSVVESSEILKETDHSDGSGDLVDSDSDGAPEDVTFLTSKDDALREVQQALRQIEGEKQGKKLKRRQHDELFKLQKQKKLEELASRKLPEDFLDQLSPQALPVKTVLKAKPSEEQQAEDEDDKYDMSDEADDELEDTEDYISLGNDRLAGFKVVAIKEELKKSKPSSQLAAEFREKMLYGDRVKRESMQAKMAKQTKKKAQFRRK